MVQILLTFHFVAVPSFLTKKESYLEKTSVLNTNLTDFLLILHQFKLLRKQYAPFLTLSADKFILG